MTKCIEAAAENHIEFVVLDIPRWNSPLYYVATGLIGELHSPETDVGGARPFEILVAGGVSAGSFTNYMNFQYLGGIIVSEYRSGAVGGISLYIDPAAAANLTAVNIYAPAGTNRQLRTNLITRRSGRKTRNVFKYCGSSSIASQFAGGIRPAGIVASWTEDVTRFKGERGQYLLY